MTPLILRHRPRTFDQVFGHQTIVETLQRRLSESGPPHCYLFIGPTGVGKTTLARLVGRELGAEIVEFDAATHSTVDHMRSLVEEAKFTPPTARMVIIDECHRLSKPAWDAALKILEEPPSYLYFGLATTELRSVPPTIVSRAYQVKLDLLSESEIEDLLCIVIGREDWGGILREEVFDLVVAEAQGSPRLALTLLQACYDAADADTARKIIAEQGVTEPMQQILQLLLRNEGGWKDIRPLLGQIAEAEFTESSLIHAGRYVIGAIKREASEQKARRHWELLAYLTYPSRSFDPYSLFVAAICRMLWSTQ